MTIYSRLWKQLLLELNVSVQENPKLSSRPLALVWILQNVANPSLDPNWPDWSELFTFSCGSEDVPRVL